MKGTKNHHLMPNQRGNIVEIALHGGAINNNAAADGVWHAAYKAVDEPRLYPTMTSGFARQCFLRNFNTKSAARLNAASVGGRSPSVYPGYSRQ
jgi:hypothetical protein